MRVPIDITEDNTLFSSLDLRKITPQKRKIIVRKFLQTHQCVETSVSTRCLILVTQIVFLGFLQPMTLIAACLNEGGGACTTALTSCCVGNVTTACTLVVDDRPCLTVCGCGTGTPCPTVMTAAISGGTHCPTYRPSTSTPTSNRPTSGPTLAPTIVPSMKPSLLPSCTPTAVPTGEPTTEPYKEEDHDAEA